MGKMVLAVNFEWKESDVNIDALKLWKGVKMGLNSNAFSENFDELSICLQNS